MLLQASGVQGICSCKHNIKQPTYTHVELRAKIFLNKGLKAPENVNPLNQSGTPVKIDIGNDVQIVFLLIIVW